jgi:hypothetical protein
MRESGVVIQTVEGFRMRRERREEGNQPFCQGRGVCRRREEVSTKAISRSVRDKLCSVS